MTKAKTIHPKAINEMGAAKITSAGAWAASTTPLTNATTSQPYTAPELRPYAGRPGAMNAYALPSRTNNRRTWPDGRVVELEVV